MSRDPRETLRRHGLRARRSLSQNFLRAPHVARRIAAALELPTGSTVLELGPGTGALTRPLLDMGFRVLALELDPAMRALLHEEFSEAIDSGALCILEGDAAALDVTAFADARGLEETPVAGNLPYAVTGAILRRLVEGAERVPVAVLMVQQEVADRLLADPGSRTYGLASLFVQARFHVERLLRVPPGAFHPPPKVWSAVVRLRRHPTPRARITPAFEAVVRAAFAQRRKTLRNALAPLVEGSRRPSLEACLRKADIDPRARGETLSVEQFERLAVLLKPWLRAAP